MARKRNQTGLNFQTASEKKYHKSRKGLFVFLAVLLVIALASLYVWLSDNPIKDDILPGVQNKTGMQDEVDVLFAGVRSDGKMLFVDAVHVDTDSGEFTVTGENPVGKYKGKTYGEIYSADNDDSDSAEDLVKAVEHNMDVDFDRYVILTEGNAPQFMEAVGYYEVTFQNDIDYHSDEEEDSDEDEEDDEDFRFYMIAGSHTLSGSEFFNYLRWVGLGYTDGSIDAQADVIGDFLAEAFNQKNANKGQDLFESMADIVDTDINISDFARYYDFICELADGKMSVSVVHRTEE